MALPETGLTDPNLASFDEMMRRFLTENRVPGAALAVTRNGKLVYARGFGWADVQRREPVQPESLFRIASVAKPITAVAVMQLVEKGKLRLDAPAFAYLRHLRPLAAPGQQLDLRLRDVKVQHLLQHRGGWDRDLSFDPMFRSVDIARTGRANPPADATMVIRYMLAQRLQANPGTRYAYSNFGYCVLGRLIEQASGQAYEAYVRRAVLEPLGIRTMRLARTRAADRAKGEVTYYVIGSPLGSSVFTENLGQNVPEQYGAWCIEAMDAHGGWIASAVDLARFAAAFDDPAKCDVLGEASVRAMFACPSEARTPDGTFYPAGWCVRPAGAGVNAWHSGRLPGTSTILVRRHDGINWVVLFNADRGPDDKPLAGKIDALVHAAADAVRVWPEHDLFEQRR